MTTTVRLPLRIEQMLGRYCVEHRRSKSEVIIELLEQRFLAEQTGKTPYELACESGFLGSLDIDEDTASQSGSRAKDAIASKHGRSTGA
jgi:hypothetical protein